MKKIAIIGSGIAGMTCAHLLSRQYQVQLFEQNDYLGGHTATVEVNIEGKAYQIDTGFIVFNDRTYPLFEKLLAAIGVGRQATEMSFSVHHVNTGFEYNGHSLSTLFAQRRNILRPRFWRLLYDITRFNRLCKSLYQTEHYQGFHTLGELLEAYHFNEFFQQHYILPMGAAIWSTSLQGMKEFELPFFVRFFYHHGLLDITGRPQWYVIPGGSKQYIAPLLDKLADSAELNCKINSVERTAEDVTLVMADGRRLVFDYVVFACHSDQALALLAEPSVNEQAVLGAIPYTPNEVVLHTDSSILPKRKAAWASWNYRLDGDKAKPATVTYNMNILQGLDSHTTFCVTLNGTERLDSSKILRRFTYHHPVFNRQSMQAQRRRSEINGVERSFFCGAYWYNGFHEDGVRSAVDVAALLGVEFE
ncbi:NAD(P)/FAD-dependent oxidoreductase [Pseudoalteromonas fenneropenaei]|uniref:NAD(P)/FAD-dependent oxidoreductase n=1 Tax=Pseudoalteromonas fenneropenaei TaxID=1737459 RepID=A0ABV7CMK8_9GAMM